MDTASVDQSDAMHATDPQGASSDVAAAIPVYSAQVEDISQELMGYIADKWTLVVLEELHAGGAMRFSALRKVIPGISQKMLTQTLRQMERNGLVSRKIYPVIPPRVEYQRTALGGSLGRVICGLWTWVESNSSSLIAARVQFDARASDQNTAS